HVFSGTLLVMKERLSRHNSQAIFTTPPKTVNFDELLKRLKNDASVTLEEYDRKLLRDVQTQRNKLEHYDAKLNLNKARALIGALVDFVHRFLDEQLQEDLLRHVHGVAAHELSEMKGIGERLRKKQIEEWKERASKYE